MVDLSSFYVTIPQEKLLGVWAAECLKAHAMPVNVKEAFGDRIPGLSGGMQEGFFCDLVSKNGRKKFIPRGGEKGELQEIPTQTITLCYLRV